MEMAIETLPMDERRAEMALYTIGGSCRRMSKLGEVRLVSLNDVMERIISFDWIEWLQLNFDA